MWGAHYPNPRVKCFLCQGSGVIHICKNPLKENLINKKNAKLKEEGKKEEIIGDVKTACFQCGGIGYFQIDTDSDDFRKRHNLL